MLKVGTIADELEYELETSTLLLNSRIMGYIGVYTDKKYIDIVPDPIDALFIEKVLESKNFSDRDIVRRRLYLRLGTIADAIKIEKLCYDTSNYKNAIYEAFQRIDKNSITSKRCGHEFTIKDSYTTNDISIKKFRSIAFKQELSEIKTRMGQSINTKASNLFKCPHCGDRKSFWMTRQKRSADEEPNYDCTCLNSKCGKTFQGHY